MEDNFEVAKEAFEIDQNVREMIEFVNEITEGITGTIEVPVEVLHNLAEMLNQLNTCVKSLYEFSATVMDQIQEETEE